jgi:hypothetical protein
MVNSFIGGFGVLLNYLYQMKGCAFKSVNFFVRLAIKQVENHWNALRHHKSVIFTLFHYKKYTTLPYVF